jgi:hypothetical protein
MSGMIYIGDQSYDPTLLSEKGRQLLKNYLYVMHQLEDFSRTEKALIRAKNAHISELRDEIVRSKTGIDLSSLLSD